MKLKIKKLNSKAIVPYYAHPDDAGFDLFSTEIMEIAPMSRVQIPIGIAIEIPEGFVGLIWDKSGLSHKNGLKTLGGVIDSGYRGEVKVGLINLSSEVYLLEKGHKVAQMIIQKKETCEIVEVDELSDTSRGEGGFGSTGK
jgi:dUTP pyrophosphatase